MTHILQTGLLSLLELHLLFKVEICKLVHNAYCLHAPNHKLLKKARVVNPAGKVQNNERTPLLALLLSMTAIFVMPSHTGNIKPKYS